LAPDDGVRVTETGIKGGGNCFESVSYDFKSKTGKGSYLRKWSLVVETGDLRLGRSGLHRTWVVRAQGLLRRDGICRSTVWRLSVCNCLRWHRHPTLNVWNVLTLCVWLYVVDGRRVKVVAWS
jgi:hypothetical protein